ncbi:Uncharacterized protein Adt_06232 [Abeliophyllum distichum]|uniref:C2 domain-containing protein n=1 Tax=Abeliophyllum distichum TaxID=126358 RepID=A0ABD1V6R6_9LAMI
MIRGFNQKGQGAIGMIRLKLQIGDLNSLALFHVIDAKISYEFLIGRVWLYENVVAESKPFFKEEFYFADAKLYLEGEELHSVGLSLAGFKIREDTKTYLWKALQRQTTSNDISTC